MTADRRRLLELLGEISRADDATVTLDQLARRSGSSPYHLHRTFRGFTGETPKGFVQRVRLERAAATLVSSGASVLQIALDHGFASHEVFTRAFHRHFGMAPRDFRSRAGQGGNALGAKIMKSVSPCLGLYRVVLNESKERTPVTTLQIEYRVLEREQPILFIRRRLPRAELQQTMAECFGRLFGHAAKNALPVAGQPVARYVSVGAGLWTIDFVMPLAAASGSEGEMQPGTLPAGPVAFAVHQGPYDNLGESNAAIERWIEDSGYQSAGGHWECYVTDPGEVPDPSQWRTEIFWPLAS